MYIYNSLIINQDDKVEQKNKINQIKQNKIKKPGSNSRSN